MTVAICIKCGAEKFGALVPCRKCDFYPHDVLDKAKSTVLSDHHLEVAELRRIGQEIRDGKQPQLPQDVIDEYVAVFETDLLSQRTNQSKPSWLSTLMGYLGVILIPIGFIVLMVFGFTIAGKLVGRPATSPMSSGTIVEMDLTSGESQFHVGSRAAVFYDYVRVDGADGTQHWIPREQVKRIVLRQ